MATRLVAGSACFVAAVLAGAAVPARAQCYGVWAQAELGSQDGHVMVYDPVHGRVLLLCEGWYGGTWEWDGVHWSRLAWGAPWPKGAFSMAFDAARGRVVAFGGGTSSARKGETWEFDGAHWRLVASDGPSPRFGASAVYHETRGAIMLYGGDDGTLSSANQVWEWDGLSWTQLPTAGTPPSGGRAVYDSTHARLIVVADGTWALAGASWSLLGASTVSGGSLAYDRARDRVVCFGVGSSTCSTSNLTSEFDGVAWSQVASTGPAHRALHAIAYDEARQVCVLFGGSLRSPFCQNSGGYNDTWEWNGSAWTPRADPRPHWRYGVVGADDPARGSMLIHGGSYSVCPESCTEYHTTDTWEWNPPGWSTTGSLGSHYSRALAYDAGAQRVVAYGGWDHQPFFATWDTRTWVYTGAWTDLNISGPGQTDGAVMAYDAARARVVLYKGGSTVWELNVNSWAQVTPTGTLPPSRSGTALAYDPVNSKLLMFGGRASPSTSLNDTWLWDGSSWTQLFPSGALPSARYGHSMATDTIRNVVVMTGDTDTWEWDGAEWTKVGQHASDGKSLSGATFNATLGAVYAFGYDAMWQWVPGQPPVFFDSPHDTDFLVGQTAMLECTTEQVGPVTFQWRKDGVPVVDDGRIRGSHTMRLVFEQAELGDNGCYDVVCTGSCGSVTSEVGCLGVFCPADFYQDGFVNGVDFDYFVDLFYWGDPGADFDNNGFVNGVDFDSFIEAFVAGC